VHSVMLQRTPFSRARARMVYLDWNATTPLAEQVVLAMNEATQVGWANPASVHGSGRRARAFVENARAAVGRLAALDPRDAVLTSGGTEANNLALRAAFPERRGVLVISALEHPSVSRTAEALADEGVELLVLPANPEGTVDLDELRRVLEARSGDVRLISVQAVNHETGVIQPIPGIVELAARFGVLLHSDAVQAAGRLAVELWRGADLVTIASHKLRGPKGVGALATKCGIKVQPVLQGGAQERGIRPGTQDPIACAGFAAALDRASSGPLRYLALAPLRDRLEAELSSLGGKVNGRGPRAPHVLNVSFAGWLGPELCAAVDLEGVCVSSGAACSAGTADPSPVLTAMLGVERARSAVRISLGDATTELDIVEALSVFERVLARARPSRAG